MIDNSSTLTETTPDVGTLPFLICQHLYIVFVLIILSILLFFLGHLPASLGRL